MATGIDPFRLEPGARSGRIDPASTTPAEGDYVYCFGSDQAGWTKRLTDGDEVAITQTGEHSPADVIRWKITARGPSEMPSGWTWWFAARVGGTEVWRARVDPGRTRTFTDLGIPTAGLAATIDLGFALYLEGPSGEVEDIEIPAVYLDELVLDAAAADFLIANRDPQQNAVQVPRDTTVAFDLLDTTGSSASTAATQVWVDGVLAYDGAAGGAQPGFTVAVSTPVSGAVRFVVTVLPMPFESEAVAEIRVVSENVAGTASLDRSWTFTAADETPPRLLSAEARALRSVRVVFDEPMTAASSAGAADVLNPSNWTLEPLQPDSLTPAVALNVTAVSAVSETTFDLELDEDPSFIDYRAICTNVEDAYGNPIAAPLNRASFAAFVPPVPARRSFDLWSFLSGIARRLDDVGTRDLKRFINVIQEQEDLILAKLDGWADILDVDTCPESYLDAMLVGLGNPFPWVEELTATDKRRLIRVLVDIYRQKGTNPGIVNVVRFFLGIEVEVDEYSSSGWVLDVDELGETSVLGTDESRLLYSFDILTDVILTDDQRRRIAQIVDYMKPAHTHHVRTVDASTEDPIDHLELGLSELSPDEWVLW